jgi:hypothetical protein
MTRTSPLVSPTFAVTALALLLATSETCFAWGCARSVSGSGRWGGSFSHSSSTSWGGGSFSHSGSGSWTSPSGQTYSGSHSGSGTYGWGGATWHGTYSGSGGASGSYSGAAVRTPYSGYHGYAYPVPAYGCYGSSGFGAGFAAGAVTGAAVTAAAATASQPSTTYVVPASGVYVAPTVVTQPVVVAAPAVVPAAVPIGTTVTVLPTGFRSEVVNGVQYYQAGSTWYQLRIQNGSAVFVVVPAP